METFRLPREIVDDIFEYLDNSTLQTTRLVCHVFGASATEYLFHTVTMTPSVQGIKNWQNILNSDHLRRIPRTAIINTCPVREILLWKTRRNFKHKGVSYWQPDKWLLIEQSGKDGVREHDIEEERYRALYSAFGDLAKLTNLQEVCLNFAPDCDAIETVQGPARDFEFETPDHREDLLRRLLASLRNRPTDPDASSVTSLSIQNLQYLPSRSEILEDLHAVLNKVQTLELLIAQDEIKLYSEWLASRLVGERRTFMTDLETDWLMPASSQLRSLSITFRLRWGALMRRFRGYNLNLPQLRYLSLGRYRVANNDSLDWVLKQTSLQNLYLWDCRIVSYVYLGPDGPESLSIDTCDWVERPVREYFDEADGTAGVFQYPLTWKSLFDRIRIALPNLSKFHFDSTQNREAVPRATSGKESLCSSNRYVAFNLDTWLSPWIEADIDGRIPFGEWSPEHQPNRHEETREEDSAALAQLIEEIQSKRYTSQKGTCQIIVPSAERSVSQ